MAYKEVNDYELVYLVKEDSWEAYNLLFGKYNNLIKKLAFNYYSNFKNLGLEYDDYIQAGVYGFLNAINYYSEDSGVLFFTCAKTFISREIAKEVKKAGRLKHSIINGAISMSISLYDDGDMDYYDIIGNNSIEEAYDSYLNMKSIIDYKYCFNWPYSLVYELKCNGFSNKEISVLLDLKYKTVDNCLSFIKKHLNISSK